MFVAAADPFNSGVSVYLTILPGMLLEPPTPSSRWESVSITKAKFSPGGQSKTIRAECHHIPMGFIEFATTAAVSARGSDPAVVAPDGRLGV
jgi:hypothetical protein